jgi:type II secretory pathway component PulL
MVRILPQVVQSVTRAAGRPSKNTLGEPDSMAVPPQRGQLTVSVLRAAGLPDIADLHVSVDRGSTMLTLFAKNNQTFPKVRDQVQSSYPGVRYPEIRKNPQPTKKHLKKHLSPSRRRALCKFFVQTWWAVQSQL